MKKLMRMLLICLIAMMLFSVALLAFFALLEAILYPSTQKGPARSVDAPAVVGTLVVIIAGLGSIRLAGAILRRLWPLDRSTAENGARPDPET